MPWTDYIAFFFGGVFATNAVPHMVCGLTGRPFQSPFAKPPGVGLSSSMTNVLWGTANLAIAYALLGQVGSFDPHDVVHAGIVGLAVLLRSMLAARHFGKFHGGNAPA